jgi:DNA invertase Pin-like site-specific DNA recombinase
MLVGSMRVSSDTDRQTTDLPRDALLDAEVEARQLCADKASGTRDDRPGRQQALASVQPGDCLIVWKLDRPGRSHPHLLQMVTTLESSMSPGDMQKPPACCAGLTVASLRAPARG